VKGIQDKTNPAPASALPVALSSEARMQWILRVGVAGCFIGHGAFGVITKADWLPYFQVMGVPDVLSWQIMPLLGTMDITLGLLMLVCPVRGLLGWMAFWATWTALLRPLAGQGGWEFFERAGNFGVPIALLYLSGWPRPTVAWLCARVSPRVLTRMPAERMKWILRITTASLLIGHGGFGAFVHKAAWTGYFGALGIDAGTVQNLSLVSTVGWLEIVLGLVVLVRPGWKLLLFVVCWKISTELLRLPAGEAVWEVVERFGSYAAPLALMVLLRHEVAAPRTPHQTERADVAAFVEGPRPLQAVGKGV
jgi:hypothetical protein